MKIAACDHLRNADYGPNLPWALEDTTRIERGIGLQCHFKVIALRAGSMTG
jgi:hypothetical protein